MNKTLEMVLMLDSRNLNKIPFKLNAQHHTWAQRDAIWQLKEHVLTMAFHFVRDVFVITKKQVNRMIRQKAKYDKSTKHFPSVIPEVCG